MISVTPASDSGGWAVDTSVAVAALDESHAAHLSCRPVVAQRRPALAGHAGFETYSVLTRLPGPQRASPALVSNVLARAFPIRCWLDQTHQNDLLERLGDLGITGGMVYDALVGESARRVGRVLLTRDGRAQRTYDLLGVSDELLT